MKRIVTIVYKFLSSSTSFSTAHSTIALSREDAMDELRSFLGNKISDIEVLDITEQNIRQGAL